VREPCLTVQTNHTDDWFGNFDTITSGREVSERIAAIYHLDEFNFTHLSRELFQGTYHLTSQPSINPMHEAKAEKITKIRKLLVAVAVPSGVSSICTTRVAAGTTTPQGHND
jgi:hypothetical protein